MPWTPKQGKLWRAAEHNPQIARNVGISHEKATEFAHEGVSKVSKKRDVMGDHHSGGHHASFRNPLNPARPEHNPHPAQAEMQAHAGTAYLRKDEHPGGGKHAEMAGERRGSARGVPAHEASAYKHGMEGPHVGGDVHRERLNDSEAGLRGHSAANLGRREHHDGSGGRNETNSPASLAREVADAGAEHTAEYGAPHRSGFGNPQGGQTHLDNAEMPHPGHPTDVGVWPHPDLPMHVGQGHMGNIVDGTRGTQQLPAHQFAAEGAPPVHEHTAQLAHALLRARGRGTY